VIAECWCNVYYVVRLLYALGIRGIGIQNAKDISKLYSGNFFKFWHDLKTATGAQPLLLFIGFFFFFSNFKGILLSASLTDEEALQLARTNLKVNSRKKVPKQDSNAINTTTTTTASLERNWGEEFAFLQSASEKITTSLFAFARNQQSVEIVDSLLEHVNIVGDFSTQESRPTVNEVANNERSEGKVVSTTLPEDKSLPLKGRVILFTGKAKFSRAEMMKRCEQLGKDLQLLNHKSNSGNQYFCKIRSHMCFYDE
jgi:NAD-dependent DNA ligase